MISQIKVKQLALLVGDGLFMFLALFFALLLRHFEVPGEHVLYNHARVFSLNFVVWLLIFYISGLYNLNLAINRSKFIESSLKAITASALFSVFYFYIFSFVGISPKTILLIYFVVYLMLYFAWRFSYFRGLKNRVPRINLAIIGENKNVHEIISDIQKRSHLGYDIKIIVDRVEDVEELKNQILREKINEVIIATDIRKSESVKRLLFECLKLNVNLTNLTQFYEGLKGKIHLELIDRAWFVENFNKMNSKWFNATKRCYDVVISFVIFIVSAPLWPIVIALIKLDSRGPIFFCQTRVGKNEEEFTLIKFRTMSVSNNDESLTIKEDPRITRFGSFLRTTRIDEIPQVLNVLRGDMSIIGPRPERPGFVHKLSREIPFYSVRMLIKPGITGWDQISGEYHSPSYSDTISKLQNDFYYIKNRSLYLDISILLKTIATVLSRSGR